MDVFCADTHWDSTYAGWPWNISPQLKAIKGGALPLLELMHRVFPPKPSHVLVAGAVSLSFFEAAATSAMARRKPCESSQWTERRECVSAKKSC